MAMCVALACGQVQPSYSADVPGSSPAFWNDDALIVFPGQGSVVSLRLPFVIGRGAFSPDGRLFYASRFSLDKPDPGVFRVDLQSLLAERLPGTPSFSPIYDLRVSANGQSVVLSGQRRMASGLTECGVFEVNISLGTVRVLVEADNSQCEYTSSWHNLSVSSDGRTLIGTRGGEVFSIDIATQSLRTIGKGISPVLSGDGKWLAAFSAGKGLSGQELWIADATTLSNKRVLARVDGVKLAWAPDSRHLLFSDTSLVCGGYSSTLKILDVVTGRITTVENSRCRITGSRYGWVADSVWRH
jgi:hypothetical protein